MLCGGRGTSRGFLRQEGRVEAPGRRECHSGREVAGRHSGLLADSILPTTEEMLTDVWRLLSH